MRIVLGWLMGSTSASRVKEVKLKLYNINYDLREVKTHEIRHILECLNSISIP